MAHSLAIGLERRPSFFHDCDGKLISVAVSWTSLGVEDPFVTISSGRSLFRVEDLLALSTAVERVWDERSEVEYGDRAIAQRLLQRVTKFRL